MTRTEASLGSEVVEEAATADRYMNHSFKKTELQELQMGVAGRWRSHDYNR